MTTASKTRHPAAYSAALLPLFAELLDGYERVLDPFAGTGRLRSIRPDAYLLEIEPEWAALGGATVGDALAMPWNDGYFDAVCTSPTYGNRMADHHNARDESRRNTYRHTLGRPLHPHNSGALQWGEAYRTFHTRAWAEIARVLRPGGRFVLNVSDHIRRGQRVEVCAWHLTTVTTLPFAWVATHTVQTPRQRYGANGHARVVGELVFVFERQSNPICLEDDNDDNG